MIAIAIDTRVGDVPSTAVVGAGGARGLLVLLVGVDGILDLVDESRHVVWLFEVIGNGLGYQSAG